MSVETQISNFTEQSEWINFLKEKMDPLKKTLETLYGAQNKAIEPIVYPMRFTFSIEAEKLKLSDDSFSDYYGVSKEAEFGFYKLVRYLLFRQDIYRNIYNYPVCFVADSETNELNLDENKKRIFLIPEDSLLIEKIMYFITEEEEMSLACIDIHSNISDEKKIYYTPRFYVVNKKPDPESRKKARNHIVTILYTIYGKDTNLYDVTMKYPANFNQFADVERLLDLIKGDEQSSILINLEVEKGKSLYAISIIANLESINRDILKIFDKKTHLTESPLFENTITLDLNVVSLITRLYGNIEKEIHLNLGAFVYPLFLNQLYYIWKRNSAASIFKEQVALTERKFISSQQPKDFMFNGHDIILATNYKKIMFDLI